MEPEQLYSKKETEDSFVSECVFDVTPMNLPAYDVSDSVKSVMEKKGCVFTYDDSHLPACLFGDEDASAMAECVRYEIRKAAKTIKSSELQRLAFCNSKKLPGRVWSNGRLVEWTGIGWIRVDAREGAGAEPAVADAMNWLRHYRYLAGRTATFMKCTKPSCGRRWSTTLTITSGALRKWQKS